MHPAIRSSIATLILLQVLTAPAHVVAQDTAAFAQQRFVRGVQLFDAHQFTEALGEFHASFELYQSPNSRLYIARTLRELGRTAEAVAEFEITALQASDRASRDLRFVATRDAAERELRRIKPTVGRVVVTVTNLPAGARVLVSGRELPPPAFGIPIAVMPGSVAVVVEQNGQTLERRDLSVAAGQNVAISLALTPPPRAATAIALVALPTRTRHREDSGTLGPAVVAAFGATIAAGITAGVFAGLAARTYQDLRSRCGSGPCTEADSNTIRAGQNYQTATQVALGVTVAGLLTGAVLLFVNRGRERAIPVQVGFTPMSIVVAGAF